MSTAPMMKTCPKCGHVYSYNPSVGQISCPKCQANTIKEATKTVLGFFKK